MTARPPIDLGQSPDAQPPTPTQFPPDDAALGATWLGQATRFGVWAPHATAVQVVGDFNGWQGDAHPMQRRAADGTWWAELAEARPGSAYRFRLQTAAGDWVERIDPRARAVSNSVGHGVVTDPDAFDWQGDAFETPGHERLVVYELHVGSFNPPEADRVGCFDDVIERLPHLQRLGITAIQVMPVAEFAGDRSWGYNPAHPYAVESAYGGPEGFKRLVRAAHQAGIAVILDVVYNHFGPSDLQLWRFDGWHPEGDPGEGGGIYFYNDHRASTPWGDTRPDYGRGEVRQYIRDNALMWLDEYHVDGLRLDMTLYMRSIAGSGGDDLPDGWSLMQWVTSEVRRLHPRAITISEDLRQLPELTAPAEAGGAGFHAQWDARFVHPVRAAVTAVDDAQRSMSAVAAAVAAVDHGNAFSRVVYTESHDEVANGSARVPYEIAGDDTGDWYARKRSTLGAALVCTAPGIPMLFQGQEFLQGEWFRDDVPLDWEQATEWHRIVRLYRDLIGLRLNLGGRTPGLLGHGVRITHANEADNVLAFLRWDTARSDDPLQAPCVVVLVNLSDRARDGYTLGLPQAGRWRVCFNSDSRWYGRDFGNAGSAQVTAEDGGYDGLPAQGTVSLPAYSVLVLAQDPGPG